MEFDVFEKLSELETRVYVLEKELKEKDAVIEGLMARNAQLEQEHSSHLSEGDLDKCDLAKIGSGKSIADALKETSETALRHTGYTFDERTGLYFDRNSGYYYDPDNRLFFEPSSGVYYAYNVETGEYTYQSSIDSARWKVQYAAIQSRSQTKGEIPSLDGDTDGLSRRTESRSPHSLSRRSCTYSDSDDSTEYRRRRLHRRVDSPRSSGSCSARKHHKSNRKRRRRYSSSSIDDDNEHKSLGTSQQSDKLVLEARPMVYPPGVRLVVLASAYTELGTVFILNSEESSKGWGCIGRNPDFCPSANFPDDPDVSTIHCEIIYEGAEQRYVILDRESSSGTYVNGKELEKRVPFALRHGDILRIGSSRLLVHIHRGPEICVQCDSDSVKLAIQSNDFNEELASTEQRDLESSKEKYSARSTRDTQRREVLNLLKEKYGIKHLSLNHMRKNSSAYNDRAARRRAIEANLKAAGFVDPPPPSLSRSQDPNVEKPESVSASVSVPIGADNRGAKLLAKMGWNPGQGLGKDSSGILEPVSVSLRVNKQAGFGSKDTVRPPDAGFSPGRTSHQSYNARTRALTRERYMNLK